MRHYPNDKSDKKDAKEIGALPWMLNALRLNPSYMGWGPHEDYMIQKKGSDHGWATNLVIDSWKDFQWTPDDLNVIANFYFEIDRESKKCPTCGGSGFHVDAQWVTNSWYRHTSPFTVSNYQEMQAKAIMESFGGEDHESQVGRGVNINDPRLQKMVEKYGEAFLTEHCVPTMQNGGAWSTCITQDESDALWKEGRLREFKEKPTAEQVNQWARGRGFGHDSINHWICCEQRLKRLGIPQHCPECEGNGYLYTVPTPRLDLILWALHPRKGCGRAVTVKNIQEAEVKLAIRFLKKCHSTMTNDIWKRILKWPRMPRVPEEPRPRKKPVRKEKKNGKKKQKA